MPVDVSNTFLTADRVSRASVGQACRRTGEPSPPDSGVDFGHDASESQLTKKKFHRVLDVGCQTFPFRATLTPSSTRLHREPRRLLFKGVKTYTLHALDRRTRREAVTVNVS